MAEPFIFSLTCTSWRQHKNIRISLHGSVSYSQLPSLLGARPTLLASFSSSVAWPPCCSSPACNSSTLALRRRPGTSQSVWPAPHGDSLTFSQKSFCICWLGFTLQEFLRTKVNTKTSVNTTGTEISACVNMLRLLRAGQTGSLTFGPHCSAFWACVCAVCAFPTECAELCSRGQINERLLPNWKKKTRQQWLRKASGGIRCFQENALSNTL